MTNQKMDWELTSENSKIEYVTILIRLYALSTKTLIYQDLVSAGIFLKWLNKQTQLIRSADNHPTANHQHASQARG